MKMNATADVILDTLKSHHARTYRNRAPQKPVFPYVVFRLESVIDTTPSDDLYLNVDIYDSADSIRVIEDLADKIDNDLNGKIINTDIMNLHFVREQRQFVPSEQLVSANLLNLRYVVRAYYK